MNPGRWIWETCFLGKQPGLQASLGVITQHFIYAFLLWCFDDNWQVSCESSDSGNDVGVSASGPPSPVEPGVVTNGRVHSGPPVDSTLVLEPSVVAALPRTIHIAPAAAAAITPSLTKRLASPGAVDTSNFQAPIAVYVAVPIVTFVVGAFSVYSYCSWKKRMLKNRDKKIEKVVDKRRRISIMPGSAEARGRAQNYGLTERSGKSEHDPAALITFSTAIAGLATELDTVDQMVLDYQSLNAGEAIPQGQKVVVENEAYNVTINPLYNALQAGACGYVLSGEKNPVLRLTEGRRTSLPFRLEHSAYPAPPTPPPKQDHEVDHHSSEDGHTGSGSGSDEEETGASSGGVEEGSWTTATSPGMDSGQQSSSAGEGSTPTDTPKRDKQKRSLKRVMMSLEPQAPWNPSTQVDKKKKK